jgi:hypothetical protein
MNILILVSIVLLSGFRSQAGEFPCAWGGPGNSHTVNRNNVQDTLRAADLVKAGGNLQGICQQSSRTLAAKMIPFSKCGMDGSVVDRMSYQTIRDKILECEAFNSGSVWHAGYYPSPALRRAAHDVQIREASAMLTDAGSSERDVFKLLDTTAKTSVRYSPGVQSAVNQVIERKPASDAGVSKTSPAEPKSAGGVAKSSRPSGPDSKKPDNNSELSSSAENAMRLALCASYLSASCNSALLQIKQTVGGKFVDRNFSLEDETREVFSNPAYAQGAAIAARKIQAKINSIPADAKKAAVSGNLLHDIYDSYRESGANHVDAEKMAWNLLAVYSTKGASLKQLQPLANSENASVLASLFVISSGINYLDAVTTESGHPYSLPPNVQSSCSYGKPYHFWMPAFLSRKLVLNGYSPSTAHLASHLAGMAYEFMDRTSGRDPTRPLREGAFADYANALRINLAVNDAGAVFGANSRSGRDANRPINLDSGMNQMFERAMNLRPISDEEARRAFEPPPISAYLRWRNIIAPDAAYFSIK